MLFLYNIHSIISHIFHNIGIIWHYRHFHSIGIICAHFYFYWHLKKDNSKITNINANTDTVIY